MRKVASWPLQFLRLNRSWPPLKGPVIFMAVMGGFLRGGLHGFQGKRRGDQSSLTQFKGGTQENKLPINWQLVGVIRILQSLMRVRVTVTKGNQNLLTLQPNSTPQWIMTGLYKRKKGLLSCWWPNAWAIANINSQNILFTPFLLHLNFKMFDFCFRVLTSLIQHLVW